MFCFGKPASLERLAFTQRRHCAIFSFALIKSLNCRSGANWSFSNIFYFEQFIEHITRSIWLTLCSSWRIIVRVVARWDTVWIITPVVHAFIGIIATSKVNDLLQCLNIMSIFGCPSFLRCCIFNIIIGCCVVGCWGVIHSIFECAWRIVDISFKKHWQWPEILQKCDISTSFTPNIFNSEERFSLQAKIIGRINFQIVFAVAVPL